MHQKFKINEKKECLLNVACANDNIKQIQKLLNDKSNVKFNLKKAFNNACENGQTDVIKWLLQLKPTIDVQTQFIDACEKWFEPFGTIAKLFNRLKPNECF